MSWLSCAELCFRLTHCEVAVEEPNLARLRMPGFMNHLSGFNSQPIFCLLPSIFKKRFFMCSEVTVCDKLSSTIVAHFCAETMVSIQKFCFVDLSSDLI